MPDILSYCFKAIITDATGSALLSFFSPETHSILPDIADALGYIPDPDPYNPPPIIEALEKPHKGLKCILARRVVFRFIYTGKMLVLLFGVI